MREIPQAVNYCENLSVMSRRVDSPSPQFNAKTVKVSVSSDRIRSNTLNRKLFLLWQQSCDV